MAARAHVGKYPERVDPSIPSHPGGLSHMAFHVPTKFSTGPCRFETVPVPVAVIMAVGVAGAATSGAASPLHVSVP